MKKIKLICLLGVFIITGSLYSQSEVIGSWKLDTNREKIEDQKGNFNLTKSVSTANGCISGYAERYWPSLDLQENGFVLEGYFKTNGKADAIMLIAGNRSALSAYTGWDFIMNKNGVLRFLVNDNNEKSKTLMSAQRSFDDGNEHFFSITWNPDERNITMLIDKKYKYSTSWDTSLGENKGRVFYIGAQPLATGGKTLPFKGQLRDFTFKGKLVEKQDAGNLEKMDKELARAAVEEPSLLWVDAKTLTIEGMGWNTGITDYTRLPDKYNNIVTSNVWRLSRHSSGIAVRFIVKGTNSISANWMLRGNGYMAHMTPQAINGLDLYIKQDGKWVFAGVGKPTKDGLEQETSIKGGFSPAKTYECMVYLPLYSGISSLKIGVTPGATVTAAPPNPKKPFVIYGTSMTQGCSASRTGMPYMSMLGRKFDTPVINLGFSGNGLTEEYFGTIMGEIDASIYFIDCLGNMLPFSPQEITDRTLALVRKLRSIRPNTPIVLIEDRTYAFAELTDTPTVNNRRPALKAAFNILSKESANLHYIEGDQLFGQDTEATVDGSHPSDLGMYRMFIVLEAAVTKIDCCK